MDTYIVLDIENPNARGNSICAIGLLVVKNGIIAGKKYSLINPEDRFDRTNSRLTGLTEEMTAEAPTLKEYWKEIKDLLCTEVIVGHNVRYDLSVLAKALDRYGIRVPEFRYLCTLKLSRKLIAADSYRLSSLVKSIGYTYQEHNALADAEAAYELFSYLMNKESVDQEEPLIYDYKHALKKKLDSRLASNMNDLYGIIEGMNYDGEVDEQEIRFLKNWVDENQQYREYLLFERVIVTLNRILEDGVVTDYERQELSTLVESMNHSKIYNDATLSIQILQGILKGIVCDEEIEESEIKSLQKWLENNDYLAGIYPYDKVLKVVNRTLADGVLSAKEKEELFQEFGEVLY